MRLRGGAGGAPPVGPSGCCSGCRRRPRLLLRRLWPRLLRLLLQRGGWWPRLLPRRPLPPRRLSRLLPRRWRHRFLLSGSAKRALRNCHVCLYENQTSKRFDLEPPSPEDYFKFY